MADGVDVVTVINTHVQKLGYLSPKKEQEDVIVGVLKNVAIKKQRLALVCDRCFFYRWRWGFISTASTHEDFRHDRQKPWNKE